MPQSDQDVFRIFAEAVRTIVEHVCLHQTSYNVLDFEPQIDLASKRWWLIPVIKKSYSFYGEKLFEELKEHYVINRSLELMLREDFPRRLEMRVIDREGQPVVNPDYRPYLFLEILVPLAYEYIQEFGCDFVEQNFKGLFDEMMAYIYTEGWEVVAVAPLENFELEGAEEVSIDKYRIRKLSEWEIKQIMRKGRADSLGKTLDLSFGIIENLWCVEVIYRAPKRNILGLSSNIDEFITLMRLFKKGSVSRSVIFEYPKTWKGFSPNLASWGPIHISIPKPKYILRLDEIDNLRRLWNLYNRVSVKLPQELRIALRWFNKSYEEVEIENRILYLAIAFETMFKYDRYDVLAPNFPLSDPSEKEKISKYLEKLIKERNFIVHQGHSKLKSNELEVIVTNADEIFRKYYRWFLEQIDKGRDYYEIISRPKRHKR